MEDEEWEKGERSWGEGRFFVGFEIGAKGSPGGLVFLYQRLTLSRFRRAISM